MRVVLLGFFSYGAVIHLLLLRGYVFLAYRPPADATFVNHPLTNLSFSILGGICVTCFMRALLRQTLATGGLRPSHTLVKGGLYGISATFIALQAFYVLTAIFLASWASEEAAGMNLLENLSTMLVALMSIQLYGMVPVVYSLPFAFAYGAIAGASIEQLRKYAPGLLATETRLKPTGLATTSLMLGTLGLVLYWTPLPGGVFNILAVAFGVRTLMQVRKGLASGRLIAIIGIVFGLVGFAALAIILSSDFHPPESN